MRFIFSFISPIALLLSANLAIAQTSSNADASKAPTSAPAKATPVAANDADLFALPTDAKNDDSDLFALPKTPKKDLQADIAAASEEADSMEQQVGAARDELIVAKDELGVEKKKDEAVDVIVDKVAKLSNPKS